MVWWLATTSLSPYQANPIRQSTLVNTNQIHRPSLVNNLNLLEFEPLHQLILSLQQLNRSLDRRAPVERRSGHYQRLEEKRKKEMEKEKRDERSK